MSLMKPELIDVPLDEYKRLPLLQRIRLLATDWAERGLGSPSAAPLFYVIKIAAWLLLGGWIAVASSGLGSLWDYHDWWAEPIVYQKLLLWAILWEALSIGAASGPAMFHFWPPMAGVFHWVRPGTVRRPPWGGRIPLTSGDRRTIVDVILYLAVLATLIAGLAMKGVESAELAALLPDADGGVLPTIAFAMPMVALVLLGARDQVPFLAARADQYLPLLLFGVVLGPVDFMIAAKCLIVVVWMGAAIAKIGPHFSFVIGPMMSSTPFMVFPKVNRLFYRDARNDLNPSRVSHLIGHGLGTVVEIVAPLLLLFSVDPVLAAIGAVMIMGMHVFITSTIPLAVPIEWNIHFLVITPLLFFGFPAWDGFGVGDLSSPWVVLFIALVVLPMPILGNLRPDIVSFLFAMRQYSGNWATTMWAFGPDALRRLYDEFPAATGNQEDVLAKLYGEEAAVKLLEKAIAFRSMHSQGRAMLSLLVRELGDDLETYTLREGENICGWALGWNFGDGHLHGPHFMHTVQKHMNYAPGEVVAVCVESQPIHRATQRYKVVDLALGVIEEGTFRVRDAVSTQPWLPDGPIPFSPDAAYRNRALVSERERPARKERI